MSTFLEYPFRKEVIDMQSELDAPEGMQDKVVIQYGGRIVKGFTRRDLWPSEQELFPSFHSAPILNSDSGVMEDVSLEGVKAVFFVKTFEGKSHEDLRFHDHLPPIECLWVRVTFEDGEVVEGLIRNSGNYVLQDGFFMSPIDPEGNNWLVYVFKSKLQNIEVLGLRHAPKSFPSQS